MAKATLQMRFTQALIQHKGATFVEKSRDRVKLTRPSGGFYFVGVAGALRFGRNITHSLACSEIFRQRMLEMVPAEAVTDATKKMVQL